VLYFEKKKVGYSRTDSW